MDDRPIVPPWGMPFPPTPIPEPSDEVKRQLAEAETRMWWENERLKAERD